MGQESLPPDLEWPRWQWVKTWLSLISFALSLIAFFFPGLTVQERITIGIPLLSMPIVIPLVVWSWRAGRVAYQRVHHYPRLYQHAQQDSKELDKAQRSIFALLQLQTGDRTFEILRARYDNGNLYIVLKKEAALELVPGDLVMVVHINDQRLLGQFQVTEVRAIEYYALGVNGIDPRWLNDVRQRGEIFTLPYMAAIFVPRRVKQ